MCEFLFSKDLFFNKINISSNNKEKYLEICTVVLENKSSTIIILILNRALAGDLSQFIKSPDDRMYIGSCIIVIAEE